MITADLFWAKVDRTGGVDSCWEWTTYRLPDGYGQYTEARRHYRANRVALELHLGRSLSPGELACHTCDNPPCCNPAHLYAGSPLDNVADMVTRGRCRAGARESAKTHCPQGHAYDEGNTYLTRTGKRMCRECSRARTRAWREARRVLDHLAQTEAPA